MREPTSLNMRIEIDDLSRPAVHALLQEHLDNMHELSPPEQVFALDLSRLKAPNITNKDRSREAATYPGLNEPVFTARCWLGLIP
jgi:hypothetical protein